jgi:subtilisin family serine protease
LTVKRLRTWAPALAVLALIPAWHAARADRDSGRLGPRLRLALEREAGPQLVWVHLRDKGPDAGARLAEARRVVSPRALARRARRGGGGMSLQDAPVFAGYRDEVARRVLAVRHELRWSNALSVWATPQQVQALAALPFVSRLDLVRRYRRGRELEREAPWVEAAGQAHRQAPRAAAAIDYGTSLGQVTQINVPKAHDLGLHGEGVIVAVFDGGFNNLAHEALAPLAILAQRDFVNGDDDVGDGNDRGEGSHGTNTLSVLGGRREGQLVGPAFAATFILAKTEDSESETPVEEDNWAAAAEWAESLGADVISSSLGYTDFDAPFPAYGVGDFNGETAISTKAANWAATFGMVVVNSAGNSGFNSQHGTLGAPADAHGALAIAAVDALGMRTSFSSVGPTADGRVKPDLAAQGQGVKAASSRSPSGYSSVAGTSFSCPLTAGAAALVIQAHPDYRPDQVGYVLRTTASQASKPDTLLGWGIVNTLAAIQAAPPK